ncbi:M20/M25/M40 family metallo-hydrolase [Bacteroidia bacterium]|nr:M20/M25/M40 family metallo-hydrolase [Bacteroidia bacterium]MDB4107070.1 M20/M25/M40 family metallo-hydrolase [Bacteroidia bacterium]MDB9882626.1 M20/M25/M40 family metallo-hydrolase [Bacteroidia bacterium]MDC1395106.1 M20/M25/M40 family metallo-hydrolase [Bacteroidia bacterium]
MYNLTKKIGLTTFLILLVVTISFAQKPHFKEKKTARNVEKHIKYLASDELEGRETGSRGERMSAEYIAEQFSKIGLETKGDEGYYQYMTLPNLRMAQGNTSLMIDKKVYTLFTDFYPISASSNNGRYSGKIINLGYGIEDEGLNQNDYKDVTVAGKAVIIDLDLPGGTHPHSKFVVWAGVEQRVNYAKSKGAKAVIFHTQNKDLIPSGTLTKTTKHLGMPVLFVKKDLSDLSETNGNLLIDVMLLSTTAHNVVGYIDHGKRKTVVIGAHHDHLGKGEHSGSRAEKPGGIHNGADDNASGVAALIELAKAVKKKPKHFSNNNYLFIAFTGEEEGLLGSKYFVKSNLFIREQVSYMINMDMVGHLDSTAKTLIINGVGTSPSWKEAISSISYPKRKIAKIKTTESGIGASDHTSFYLNGIPAVHFFTGQHQYYHKPTDDVEIVNFGGEAFVISYICKMMYTLDKMDEVVFSKTKDESQGRMKFKVTLGIMPDYVYDGEGLRVDGVKEGKPGYKAGLLKGDIIISLDGQSIQNMKDYMKTLMSLKEGLKTTATIRRGSETKVLNVQF